MNIDSLNAAKQLKGCTHIKGAIEIQIRGGGKTFNNIQLSDFFFNEVIIYIIRPRRNSLLTLLLLFEAIAVNKLYINSNEFVKYR